MERGDFRVYKNVYGRLGGECVWGLLDRRPHCGFNPRLHNLFAVRKRKASLHQIDDFSKDVARTTQVKEDDRPRWGDVVNIHLDRSYTHIANHPCSLILVNCMCVVQKMRFCRPGTIVPRLCALRTKMDANVIAYCCVKALVIYTWNFLSGA